MLACDVCGPWCRATSTRRVYNFAKLASLEFEKCVGVLSYDDARMLQP